MPSALQLLHWHEVPGIITVIATEPSCQFSRRSPTDLFYISKGLLQHPKAKFFLPSVSIEDFASDL